MKSASFLAGIAMSFAVVTFTAIQSSNSERTFYFGFGAAAAACLAATAAVDSHRKA